MSPLTESLIQVLLGLAILGMVIYSGGLLYGNLVTEKANLRVQVRDYNQALAQCRETSRVLSAVKK